MAAYKTSAKMESLFGEGRQPSQGGSYPGFRVAGQAPVVDVPRWNGQSGEGETIRGFNPSRESTAMFGFGQGVSSMNSSGFKPAVPVFDGKQESFSRRK